MKATLQEEGSENHVREDFPYTYTRSRLQRARAHVFSRSRNNNVRGSQHAAVTQPTIIPGWSRWTRVASAQSHGGDSLLGVGKGCGAPTPRQGPV
eukprot:5983004-Pleurochrysis_carterae.AAC.3